MHLHINLPASLLLVLLTIFNPLPTHALPKRGGSKGRGKSSSSNKLSSTSSSTSDTPIKAKKPTFSSISKSGPDSPSATRTTLSQKELESIVRNSKSGGIKLNGKTNVKTTGSSLSSGAIVGIVVMVVVIVGAVVVGLVIMKRNNKKTHYGGKKGKVEETGYRRVEEGDGESVRRDERGLGKSEEREGERENGGLLNER